MFVWVHTCPARDEEVEPTLQSIRESDVEDFEVWRHPEELRTGDDIEFWWEERLLLAAQRSEFFLRFEDDIIVAKDIMRRISSWGALEQDDFGAGTVYEWVGTPEPYMGEFCEDGSIKLENPLALLGPGIVFKSSLVPELVEKIRSAKKVWNSRHGLLNLDTRVFEALAVMGKRVYLHRPSLVDCRNLPSVNVPGTVPDYTARNFEERERP